MQLRKVRVFIASSIELETERDELRKFFGIENEKLVSNNLFLEIIQWETFLNSVSGTRLQDEYIKAISQCDIVLCLVFTKVGKYTEEEFDAAYSCFKKTGKPLIWTYFKDAPLNSGSITAETSTLVAFRDKINNLGHFVTRYSHIDTLKYQFKDQLDKALSTMLNVENVPNGPTAGSTVIKDKPLAIHIFNEKLTLKLIEAIAVFSPKAKKFLENATRMDPNWHTQSKFSDPAKEIIAFGFVGVLSMQLRKMMAIGKDDNSTNKFRRYLENCHITVHRALQLICFALLSRLWDHKKQKDRLLSAVQLSTCTNFFEDVIEYGIDAQLNLLKTLLSIFSEHKLEYPISELAGFDVKIADAKNNFLAACEKIHEIEKLLEDKLPDGNDCLVAEDNLVVIIEHLNFLANYKMISIKSIGYHEMRNSKPQYLYNYAAVGLDFNNANQDRLNYAESPINTDAVLLYRDNYRQHVNLFPFVIDLNALAIENGSKICFYASKRNEDGSLNYSFIEDNNNVNLVDTGTLRPGLDINELIMDPRKRRDMRFDVVSILMREAKKTITGTPNEEVAIFRL